MNTVVLSWQGLEHSQVVRPVAAYSGLQASHFFDGEQKNRKLALELEALGPFTEPLDKADQDKFRIQIGDRSFGFAAPETGKVK